MPAAGGAGRASWRRTIVLGIAGLVALWAPAAAALTLVPVVTGLTSPVFVTHARDGGGRLFVVEQHGVIKVLRPGAAAPTVFLDIRSRVLAGGERGLLGLTFHPHFPLNRRFFVNYTRAPDGATVIAEYQASALVPDVAAPGETVLLVIAQPFANHNGGMVEFGPDGFLYVAVGDGGAGNDPGDRAQDVSQLLGKILRIDVDRPSAGRPYSSPAGNPFAGATPGRDEIFALGLRNPFRFSFDRATGLLYAGDVGQNAVEEINVVTAGGNYGWRIWEGTRCTGNDPDRCLPTGFRFPIAEYPHAGGRCAVLGGYAYRGAQAVLPSGSYVYGDLCTGEVFVLRDPLSATPVSTVALATGLRIASFGEDEAGEPYLVDLRGTVHRLARDCAAAAAGCPALELAASVSAASFVPGQIITATIGASNPGLPVVADFYLGVVRPDGTVAFFTSVETAVSGHLADPASFRPIAVGVSLEEAFSLPPFQLFAYQWTESDLRGAYVLFVVAVRAGALGDGALTDDEILALATAPFRLE